MSKAFTFRTSQDVKARLQSLVKRLHFTDLSELIEIILTDGIHRAIFNRYTPREKPGDDCVIGVRLDDKTFPLLSYVAGRSRNTLSYWAGTVITDWLINFDREDDRQQRSNIYPLFISGYANKTRQNMTRLQHDFEQIQLKA